MQSLNGNSSNPSYGGFGTQSNPFFANDDIDENVLNNSDLDRIVINDKENNKKRDVSELRVIKKEDGVEPCHYFYEPFLASAYRVALFKNSFKENQKLYTFLKNDQNIKAPREERKKLEEQMAELSETFFNEKKWIATFSNLLIDNLKKDLPFETLFTLREASISSDHLLTYEDLKGSYEEIRSIYSEVTSIIDFQSLKPKEVLDGLLKDAINELVIECNLVKENLQKIEENKFNKAKDNKVINAKVVVNIDDELQKLRELLGQYVVAVETLKSSTEIKLLNQSFLKKDQSIIGTIIGTIITKEKKYSHLLEKFNLNVTEILTVYSLGLEEDKIAVSDFLTKFWNKTLNGSCNSIKKRILSEDINNEKFRNSIIYNVMKDKNLQNEIKDPINGIKDVTFDRSYLLKHFISKIVNEVLSKDLKNLLLEKFSKKLANKETIAFFSLERKFIMKNKNWTSLLTKEYKKHSLARFDHLFNYYTAFVNIMFNLGEIGETNHVGFKKKLVEIVAHLVEHSSIELDNFQTDNLASKAEKASIKIKNAELLKKITINPDFHRNERFIGAEKTSRTMAEQTSIRTILSLLMGIEKIEEHGEFKDMITVERSHTMPFPVLFGWLAEKMKELIDPNYNFPKNEKNEQEKHFFNKNLFEQKRLRNISHKELEDLFSKEFKSFLNLPRQELLYKSLEMTRTFFMRLFSETELLPSFMNQFADNASEWRDNDKSNYKINLSNCMKDMILKGEKIEQAQVVKVLEPYLKKTLLNVENKLENEKIEQDKVRHTPDKLSCSLFKQITFNIVKESLEMAMKRVDIDTIIHKQFLIKEIFESVNPIPYTNKEVTKEVVANLIRI